MTKSKESNRRPLSRQVLKNISDGLNLALLHRRKSSSSSAFDWLHQVFSPVDVTKWTVANINPMFVSDTTAVTQTSTRNGQTVLRAPNLLTKELWSSHHTALATKLLFVAWTYKLLSWHQESLENKIVCLSLYVLQPRHKGCSGYLWDEEKVRWPQMDLHLVWHTLLQIILDFQRTFCIAMGPPIRADTLPSQRLCYSLLPYTMWR